MIEYKKELVILVGIPCSLKSTWAKQQRNINPCYAIISRDTIREDEDYFPFGYHFNDTNEKRVTKIFNDILEDALIEDNYRSIILDNTHCKEKYIDQILNEYYAITKIRIKFFEISLFKAYWRNYIRYFQTGKWIPLKVIWQMHRNYNKINRNKYKQYEYSS